MRSRIFFKERETRLRDVGHETHSYSNQEESIFELVRKKKNFNIERFYCQAFPHFGGNYGWLIVAGLSQRGSNVGQTAPKIRNVSKEMAMQEPCTFLTRPKNLTWFLAL